MRSSLTGDLLLLAVDDRARYRTRGAPGIVLAAAELCEGLLAGRPVPALAVDPAESGRRRRRRVESFVRTEAGPALDRVAGRLVAAGAITPVEHRVLGMFTRRGYGVVDTAARSETEQRLRGALRVGTVPGPDTATLAVLAAVSGLARAVEPPPRDRAGRRAVAEHLNGLRWVVGEPVAEVLLATRAVLRRAGDAGDGFVPMSGTEAYGDSGGDGSGADGGAAGGGDGGGGGGGD
jgi:uncharacterized membrane protein YgcG